jgi:PAS domain S-box-containing protein
MTSLDNQSAKERLPDGKIARWSLRFSDAELERQYKLFRINRSAHEIRIWAYSAILVYALLGVFEWHLIPDSLKSALIIRNAIVIPVFLAALSLGYTKYYAKYIHLSIFMCIVAGGAGYMATLAQAEYPLAILYTYLIIVVSLFLHGHMGVRFTFAFAGGWSLVLAYFIVVTFINPPPDTLTLASNGILIVVTNTIIMFTNRNHEILGRRNFRNNILLSQQISERERANVALAESEAKLRSIVDNSPLCITLKDVAGRYVMANQRYCETFGVSEEQLTGKTAHDIFDKAFADQFRNQEREVLKVGEPREFEATIPTRQGLRRFFEVNFPILDHLDNCVGVGLISADITDRTILEEQLRQSQKMEAVGQLTGGIAHEFNNLLQGVLGYLEILRGRIKAEPEAVKVLDEVDKAAWRGAEITRSLLAFARKQPLQPRAIDVSEAIAEARPVLQSALTEAITVREVTVGRLWRALADPNQLQSALVNLAINARDAMPGGGVLTIEMGNASVDERQIAGLRKVDPKEVIRPGDYVRLRVMDTGHGMPPEVLKQAFDPFFTTKDVGQGTGLGLSMVYGFAKQSNGFVVIDSELEGGTRVDLYLPRDVGKTETQAEDVGLRVG